jgi:hypothetical protein
MQNDSIHIHHLDSHYRIPKSQDSPSALQRRLDHIAKGLLARAWDDRIARMGVQDNAFYFIKSMAVNLTLDFANRDDRALAMSWAGALQQGVMRTLSRRDHNVIVFRDRSEFVAGFLGDLLRGRAWENWYYHEFEFLRTLSLSQAAVRVLTDDGDTGRDALLELARRDDLDLFLTALNDAEVEAIVSHCLLPSGPEIMLTNRYTAWVQGLRSSLRFPLTAVLARDVARLYLGLLGEQPELGPDVNLARFIRDLLRLRQGDWQQHEGRKFLTMLKREVANTELAALLQDLQDQTQPAATSRVFTRYGGIFLLMPAMVEMRLHEFLQSCPYPEPQETSKINLLLSVIALQCLGSQNAAQARHDGGLARFAGLAAAPASSQSFDKLEASLQQYAQVLTTEMHEVFMKSFQAHHQETAKRTGLFLRSQNISSGDLDNPKAFSLNWEAGSFLPDREWDLALATASAAALRWFAAKLGAFADSSPDYLRRNFLESHAEIEIFADRLVVRFLTCPLQMVLRMAGFDHGTWTVPWLKERKLEFRFE